MADELVRPDGGGDITSVDWTATSNGSRGDVVRVNSHLTGFLLSDVTTGNVAPVAVECKLATVPQPSTARAWKAGDLVGWHGGELVPKTTTVDSRVGYVHNDTASTEARVPVVWRGTNDNIGYSFFSILNERTTPSFGLTEITATTAIPDTDVGYQAILGTSNTLGVRPDVPINVDYEGSILITKRRGGDHVIMETSIGYILWPDDAAKKATFWRRSIIEARRGVEASVPLDSFSNISILSIGTPIPLDAGGSYSLVESDFDNGIPIEIRLRLRAYEDDDINTRDLGISFTHLALLHGQIVTHQIGGSLT